MYVSVVNTCSIFICLQVMLVQLDNIVRLAVSLGLTVHRAHLLTLQEPLSYLIASAVHLGITVRGMYM